MSIHNRNKAFIGRLRAALYDIDAGSLRRQLGELFAADCEIHLALRKGPDTRKLGLGRPAGCLSSNRR